MRKIKRTLNEKLKMKLHTFLYFELKKISMDDKDIEELIKTIYDFFIKTNSR